MKRILVLFFVVVLVVVARIFYFTENNISISNEVSEFDAVPADAPLFAEFRSMKIYPRENPMIQEMIKAGIGVSFLSWVEKMDTLISNQQYTTRKELTESFILAFPLDGENSPEPLLIKKTASKSEQKLLEKLIHMLYPEASFRYEKSELNGHKMFSAVSDENNETVYYCFVNGLFLASQRSEIIERSVSQLSASGVSVNPYFMKANRTATGQSAVSWYVNHAAFSGFLAGLLNDKPSAEVDEFARKATGPGEKVKNFQSYAAWSELDMEIKERSIHLNGISTASDSLNHWLTIFEGQEPVKYTASEVLPKNTSFFCSFTFSDNDRFFTNLEKYNSRSANETKRVELFKKMDSEFRSGVKDIFKQLVGNEVIVAANSVPAEPEMKNTFFIVQTPGRTTTVELFDQLMQNHAAVKGVNPDSQKSIYPVDEETRFTIYRFPFPSFPGIWLGKPFTLAKAGFAAFYDNYLVFCSSENGLQDYLHQMVLDATLAKDPGYAAFSKNILSHTNVNVYVNIPRLFPLFGEMLNDDLTRFATEKEETLKKMGTVNWQVLNEKEFFFNSIYLIYNEKVKDETQTTWQSNVGGAIRTRPQLVVNHNDRINNEIFFQDSRNNLLLVTGEGRIRWSLPLSEPVISEIFQIDFLKNGKLQYLFNTKTKLYVIDRNGNNVGNFPVAFRSPATNGVNVFDYDNNRNYRYFVACENRKVVAYDFAGNIISGWDFGQTDHEVTTPVQHFRVGGKDYIVFKDKSHIYIQDRQGKTRVKTSAKFENSRNPLVLNLNGKPKIVATDSSGKVFYLYFDGNFAEKPGVPSGENHFFTVDDLNGNGVPDFVFADGDSLKVTDETGKVLFSEKFENVLQHKPGIYSIGSNLKKIGVVDAIANKIYLFDTDGKLHEGFPLQGNSEFCIGKISQNQPGLNLLVGSDGGVLNNYLLK